LLPSDVDGVAFWLSAEACLAGTNQRVGTCIDQSGNDNDAAQSDPELQPGYLPQAANGHAAIAFDGAGAPEDPYALSNLIVPDSPSLHFGTEDFAVLVVARWHNDPQADYVVNNGLATVHYAGYGGLLEKTDYFFPYRGLALFANYPSGNLMVPGVRRLALQLEIGASVLFSYQNKLNDDVWRLHSARRVGGDKIGVRSNGGMEAWTQVDVVDVSAAPRPLRFGGQVGSPFRGELAEVVIVKGPLPEETLRGLEQGLMLKYDLREAL
jgi:hypothetical protein